jgi:glycosyltransferase involved in cell wall biosynthesis
VRWALGHAPERLAILTSTLGGGGAQRSMIRLAGGMAERGYAVDLVLRRAEGHYVDEVQNGVRVVDLDAGRMLFSVPALVRYLRRERPQAVLAALNYVNIVGLWARRVAGVRTRFVVSERNTLSPAARHRRTWRELVRPKLIGRFYPWADGIVAVSEGVASDLAGVTGLPRSRIDVIPNPVITPRLKQMARAPVDHPWFGEGEPPVVLALGRLAPQKDFDTLIRAFAAVRARRVARLLILGEGPEREVLESAIARFDLESDVELPGWVTNPYPFLIRSAVFVLSSRWEGLPGALIEALYCGIPVIATDCPSGPREILDGGRHGVLVPVGEPDVLAIAIDQALSGQIPRPGRDSWEPYEQEIVVGRYLELLLGGRG